GAGGLAGHRDWRCRSAYAGRQPKRRPRNRVVVGRCPGTPVRGTELAAEHRVAPDRSHGIADDCGMVRLAGSGRAVCAVSDALRPPAGWAGAETPLALQPGPLS